MCHIHISIYKKKLQRHATTSRSKKEIINNNDNLFILSFWIRQGII